jgi:hypothetical protein
MKFGVLVSKDFYRMNIIFGPYCPKITTTLHEADIEIYRVSKKNCQLYKKPGNACYELHASHVVCTIYLDHFLCGEYIT